jgi:hypothetical protein
MEPLRVPPPSRPRRTLSACAAVVLCGLLGGCKKERPVSPSPAQAEGASFELVVLNASRERPSVDIQVLIDGKLEVDQTFSSEPDPLVQGIPPHRRFQLELTPGLHTLKATSRAGGTTLEQRFEVTGRTWALLGYAYEAPHRFAWQLQRTPILFQ